ncbi:hypothetical protein [Pandoraea sputorum]|uniref:hypothetical protein n=1 Tax=Pandoraea sputorum TaxID=93222 RepID=UPI001241BF39|nr:hypothetical protein [Pandoraea sputorum]VVE82352.1 hypothetical protein PSP31120_03591 [Pandoraea sputorum]
MSDSTPEFEVEIPKRQKSQAQSREETKIGLVPKITALATLVILVAGAAFSAGQQVANVSRDKVIAELSADNKMLRGALDQATASGHADQQRLSNAERALADTRAELQAEHQLSVSALQRIAALSEQVGKDTTCAPILKQIDAVQAALSGRGGIFITSPPDGETRRELLARLADWQKQLAACHG